MTDLLTDEINSSGEKKKNFRIQNQRFLLTYKTHINKEELENFFGKLFTNIDIKECHIAHETGDEECPYEHTHAVLEYEKAVQSRNERIFDFGKIHPHIKTLRSRAAFLDACVYISKEDPECKDLKNIKKNIVTKVWECKTIEEALEKNVARASDVSGVITLHQMRPRIKIIHEWEDKEWKWREWQQQIIDTISNCYDDNRTVHWLFDEKGNGGKSMVGKYLQWLDKNSNLYIKVAGKITDVTHIIKKACDNGWNGHCLWLDIPRSLDKNEFSQKALATLMENIKDKVVFSGKYDSSQFEIQNNWLIVSANFLPNVGDLSKDRWDIHEVGMTELRPLTLKDVAAKKASMLVDEML